MCQVTAPVLLIAESYSPCKIAYLYLYQLNFTRPGSPKGKSFYEFYVTLFFTKKAFSKFNYLTSFKVVEIQGSSSLPPIMLNKFTQSYLGPRYDLLFYFGFIFILYAFGEMRKRMNKVRAIFSFLRDQNLSILRLNS